MTPHRSGVAPLLLLCTIQAVSAWDVRVARISGTPLLRLTRPNGVRSRVCAPRLAAGDLGQLVQDGLDLKLAQAQTVFSDATAPLIRTATDAQVVVAGAAAPLIKSATDAQTAVADAASPIMQGAADAATVAAPVVGQITGGISAFQELASELASAPPATLAAKVAGGVFSGVLAVGGKGVELAVPVIEQGVQQSAPIVGQVADTAMYTVETAARIAQAAAENQLTITGDPAALAARGARAASNVIVSATSSATAPDLTPLASLTPESTLALVVEWGSSPVGQLCLYLASVALGLLIIQQVPTA